MLRRVLDLWVAGSALATGDFYLEDSINRQQSKAVTLGNAPSSTVRVLSGPDSEGWYHLQINLAELTADGSSATTALANVWNRLVISAMSGISCTTEGCVSSWCLLCGPPCTMLAPW